jgi:hypothetical protein
MKRIKDVLDKEIVDGCVNWEKLEKKIDVALNAVDNNFNVVREDGKSKPLKTEDALTFKVKRKDGEFCYKVISPRTVSGVLFCSGIQIGVYEAVTGKPVFPFSPRMF